MKTKMQSEVAKKDNVLKGFIMDPTLTGKYVNEPLFKEKVEKSKEILKKYGLPKI